MDFTSDALHEFSEAYNDLSNSITLFQEEFTSDKGQLLAKSEFGKQCSLILSKIHAFAKTVAEMRNAVVTADGRLTKLELRVESSLEEACVVTDARLATLESCMERTLKDQQLSGRIVEMVEEVYDRVDDAIGLCDNVVTDELQRSLLRMETDSMATRLVLTGVPESEKEDLPDIFQRVCASIKVVVPESDLVRAERMGRPRPDSPRAILLFLANQKTADHVLFTKRRKGRITKREIDASWSDGVISIGRRVAPFLGYLKRELLTRIPTISAKAVWFGDGVLLVRASGAERPFAVRCYGDIRELWKKPLETWRN